jgi:hypothetical protein
MHEIRWRVDVMPARLSDPKDPTVASAVSKSSAVICMNQQDHVHIISWTH